MVAHALRISGGLFLIAVLGLCHLAAPAAAQTKPYSVVVSPGSVDGGRPATFTVTLTNRSSQQSIGSVNVTAPTGFGAVSASRPSTGTATVSGNVVQLRDIAIAPGDSRSVDVVANVPCRTGSFTWDVVAKQSNDFRGEGNDFGPQANDSRLTTEVSRVCVGGTALRFVGQPASARVGSAITTSRYNTPPGGPVTVEIVDSAGNRATTSNVAVSLALTGPGTLSGSNPVQAVNGLATFSDLSIDAPGSYALVASSAGLAPATSNPFRIDEAAVVCSPSCATTPTLSNGPVTLSVAVGPGDPGVLVIDKSASIDCAGYQELSPTGFDIDFIFDSPTAHNGRAKVVTATISKALMNSVPDNGASHLEMCFAAPFQFPTKPGPLAMLGLLPDCGSAPCVSKRSKTPAGQGLIEVQAPGGDKDPRFMP